MAASAKNENKARSLQEAGVSPEKNTEDIDREDEDTEKEQPVPPGHKKSWNLSGFFRAAWNKKWIILIIMLPLGATVALGFSLGFDWPIKDRGKAPVQSRSVTSPEPLQEESLAPFFIPLSPQGNRSMVRVDLTVIWSALAAVKYKRNELRIRDQMFTHIRTFIKEDKDFTIGPKSLENVLGRLLQDSLGVYNLEVKIREINYF